MVKYSCEQCGKGFSQKSHHDSHNRRKTPCVNTSIMIQPNKSPLRYPGGKTRACKKLETIMKEHFDISDFGNLISPFFGGGSFEFYIQNNYKLNIIANDKFTPLYNFWNICKIDKENLCRELTKKIDLIDKEEFTCLRKAIMGETNKLNQGIMYFTPLNI
jgi:DNA adenine methylase